MADQLRATRQDRMSRDASRLRAALEFADPAQDGPALREELRLLRAEIEERDEPARFVTAHTPPMDSIGRLYLCPRKLYEQRTGDLAAHHHGGHRLRRGRAGRQCRAHLGRYA